MNKTKPEFGTERFYKHRGKFTTVLTCASSERTVEKTAFIIKLSQSGRRLLFVIVYILAPFPFCNYFHFSVLFLVSYTPFRGFCFHFFGRHVQTCTKYFICMGIRKIWFLIFFFLETWLKRNLAKGLIDQSFVDVLGTTESHFSFLLFVLQLVSI